MIAFTPFSPVFLTIGPFAFHYYGLAYLLGFATAYALLPRLANIRGIALSTETTADFLVAIVIGVVIGGRLGEVLFYAPSFFAQHPWHIFAIWKGGMSFHGGLIGGIAAGIWFVRNHAIPAFPLADLAAIVTPIGLVFGRIANFINGELVGRTTKIAWAIADTSGILRHPSQLYEAAYSMLLFTILFSLRKKKMPHGAIAALFLVLYGLFRFVAEFFREPTAGAFSLGWATMGQLLSVPMIVVGGALWFWLWKKSDCNGGADRIS